MSSEKPQPTPPQKAALNQKLAETEIIAPASSPEANDAELESVSGGGLIENGKCALHEKSRTDAASRFALGLGAIIGASWGWG